VPRRCTSNGRLPARSTMARAETGFRLEPRSAEAACRWRRRIRRPGHSSRAASRNPLCKLAAAARASVTSGRTRSGKDVSEPFALLLDGRDACVIDRSARGNYPMLRFRPSATTTCAGGPRPAGTAGRDVLASLATVSRFTDGKRQVRATSGGLAPAVYRFSGMRANTMVSLSQVRARSPIGFLRATGTRVALQGRRRTR